MWIEKQNNGKFKYVEQYEDYLTGKQKRVSVTLDKNTASTRKTALEILMMMIEERQTGHREESNLTLGELINKYLEFQQLTLKKSSYNSTYYMCNSILHIFDKDIKVSRITANFLKETLVRSDKPNGYLNNVRNRINAIFRWGYENDYIADISFLGKFKPFKNNTRREKLEDKYLEPDELQKLLSGFKSKKWELLTRFLSLSGVRIGEAIALNAQDIDFAEHVIHIDKTIFPALKSIDAPKTLSSNRDVYMQPELEKTCRDILLFTKQESVLKGYRTKLFICNTHGDYVSYVVYNNVLKRTADRILGFDVTPHVLRHTHASLLLANGMTLDAISRRLGHDDSIITKQIYLHVTHKLKEQEEEQLKNIHIVG